MGARERRFALFTVTNGAAACLMIAAVSLLAAGAIGPGHALALAAGILHGRWRSARAEGRPGSQAWDLLALGALLFFPFDLFLLSRSLIGSALRLLTFVVIFRCANLAGQRELRQAIALSFVQMVAAAASTTDVWFFSLLAAYLAMVIWTLMAIASARDDAPAAARLAPAGRPTLALTAATVAAGGALFFAIPHLGTGYYHPSALGARPGDALTGFADRIELGAIGRIKKSRAIVMRVKLASAPGTPTGLLDPAGLPARWRGVALDTFDGRSWSVARPDRRWIAPEEDGTFRLEPGQETGRAMVAQEITLSPAMSPILFTLPGATRLASGELSSVGVDAGGTIYLDSPRLRRFTYTAWSPDPQETPKAPGTAEEEGAGAAALERERYLTLPRLDPRVGDLARGVAPEGDTDFERARRIEDFLRTGYVYSLDVDDAGVADPVTRFLIERRPGHCEYFATAMAVMLRHIGIPSRVVNGFTAGEWSGLTGAFVVRQSDAHSWVEAWIPGRGWVTFDPTPSAAEIASTGGLLARAGRAFDRIELLWDTWIIGLDLLDQRSIAASAWEAAAGWGSGAARSLGALARRAWSLLAAAPRPAAPLVLVLGGAAATATILVLARRGPGWARRRMLRIQAATQGRDGEGGAARAAAAEDLRRFEARWASRGRRRAPGQTPLEFARELERLALEPPGAALAFVRGYYRARFGV